MSPSFDTYTRQPSPLETERLSGSRTLKRPQQDLEGGGPGGRSDATRLRAHECLPTLRIRLRYGHWRSTSVCVPRDHGRGELPLPVCPTVQRHASGPLRSPDPISCLRRDRIMARFDLLSQFARASRRCFMFRFFLASSRHVLGTRVQRLSVAAVAISLQIRYSDAMRIFAVLIFAYPSYMCMRQNSLCNSLGRVASAGIRFMSVSTCPPSMSCSIWGPRRPGVPAS